MKKKTLSKGKERIDTDDLWRLTHSERFGLEIYDKLRQMHMTIKDIIYDDLWKFMDESDKNAIEAVNAVLYLAEGEVIREKHLNHLHLSPNKTKKK